MGSFCYLVTDREGSHHLHPESPAFQRGNPYPLICRSPLAWQSGDKAINSPTFNFARRKLSDLFVRHLTAFSPCKRMPTVGTLPRNGATKTHESGNLDVETADCRGIIFISSLAIATISRVDVSYKCRGGPSNHPI
jgi:hypothetical protein